MVFRFGLANLPSEPPDDPSALLTEQRDEPSPLYSPADFGPIGMQRAGEAQVIPAQFRSLGGQVAPPGFYPGQGRGLAPGGGPATEIPVPDWWKTWGPVLPEILRSLHPSVFMDRALNGPDDSVYPMATLGRGRRRNASARSRSQARADDGDWCYQRYLQERKECEDNRLDYAHPDFEDGCKKRAVGRWDNCNRNGGRPHPEEPLKWGKADEDIYFETGR